MSTETHPADRILEIFNQLRDAALYREAQFKAKVEELERQLKNSTAPPPASSSAEEIARVQSLMKDIDEKLNDASLELSAEMRLRRERDHLEAYLKGLTYMRL